MNKCIRQILFLLTFTAFAAYGQRSAPDLPQRTVSLSTVQDLDFGRIILPNNSLGGTVKIDYSGSRTLTGSLVAYPGDNYHQAILSFKLCPGRSVNVQYSPSIHLTNGAYSMPMVIDNIQVGSTLLTSSGQSFFSNKGCDESHYLKLGTTLTVGGNYMTNPPGHYHGTFEITVAYQ